MSRKLLKKICGYCSKPFETTTPNALCCSDKCRFMSYIRPDGECWVWTGSTLGGYGRIRVNGVTLAAHRFSYELHIGPIPDGLEVCHSCDNPQCASPAHLFIGTHLENMRDSVAKKRQVRGEKCGSAKLTDDDVRKIRVDNRTLRKIASDFGVSDSTVFQVKAGKYWGHVI